MRRSLLIVIFGAFLAVPAFGQVYPGYGAGQASAQPGGQPGGQPNGVQAQYQQQSAQIAPIQQQPDQMPPSQQAPIRQKTSQTPPKMIVQNGVTVYQSQNAQTGQPGAVDPNADRTMPPGYGSPYPTGPVRVAQNDSAQRGSFYGAPPQSEAAVQPIARNNDYPQTQPQPQPQPTGGQTLYTGQPYPGQPQPGQAQPGQPGPNAERERVMVGRSEGQRIIPFFLNPEEQRELDDFLLRWEKFSLSIKRYDVDFSSLIYDPTIPGANPNRPQKVYFGYFKFISPNQYVYHLEGELLDGKQITAKEKPGVEEEKIIIGDKAVFKYDYAAKTVFQFNLSPEQLGKGIADSPLPLIFGAKADEMKKRFSMKLSTPEQAKDKQIWLQAKPLLLEDQQEFLMVEVIFDKDKLTTIGLKKYDINGKAYTVYSLKNPKYNDRLASIAESLSWFKPTVPGGWKHEVKDWNVGPQSVPAESQPMTASPAGARQEIPLYSPK